MRGKGRREGRLPLPTDVGEAVVGYLRRRRAAADCRQVFVTLKAPHGPIRELVNDVTKQACRRAGLTRVGPHRLRHALAAELLRRRRPDRDRSGLAAPRSGHHRLVCKVDLNTLRGVAQPWPTVVAMTRQVVAGRLPAAAAIPRPSVGRRGPAAASLRRLPRRPGLSTVTVAAAVEWATLPAAEPWSTVGPRRMTAVQGSPAISPASTRSPKSRRWGCCRSTRWRGPFVFSPADIDLILNRVGDFTPPLRSATYVTLIGLLAATGLGSERRSNSTGPTSTGRPGCC